MSKCDVRSSNYTFWASVILMCVCMVPVITGEDFRIGETVLVRQRAAIFVTIISGVLAIISWFTGRSFEKSERDG